MRDVAAARPARQCQISVEGRGMIDGVTHLPIRNGRFGMRVTVLVLFDLHFVFALSLGLGLWP
jgi:hypothetical protein